MSSLKKSSAPPPAAPPTQLPPSLTLPAVQSPLLAHLSASPSPSLRIYSTLSASSTLVLDVSLGEGMGMATSAVWCESSSDDSSAVAGGAGGKKKKRAGSNAASSPKSDPVLAVGFKSGVVHLYGGQSTGSAWKFLGALPTGSAGGAISAMAFSSTGGLALSSLPTPANPRPSITLYTTPITLSSTSQTFPVPAGLPTTPISAIAFPPATASSSSSTSSSPSILVGSHSIHLISLTSTTSTSVLSTFPGGHSTQITQILPVQAQGEEDAVVVVTIADSDRSASVWELPTFPHDPRLKSTIPLPTPIISLSLLPSTSNAAPTLALQTLSQIFVLPLPVASTAVPVEASTPSKKSKKVKPTLLTALTTLTVTEAPQGAQATLLAVELAQGGKVAWARALGGRGVVWESEEYVEEEGVWRGDVQVGRRGVGEVLRAEQGVAGSGPKPTTRYHEAPSTSVSLSTTLPSGPPTGASASSLAPTLGSLLLAPLPTPALAAGSSSATTTTQTPLSLARLLTQALHSSDAPLLSQCLSHSDPALIRATIRKLQPELSVVLLERLGERLALGGKGRAGGAAAQRVRGVGAWTKGVLRERVGYLMTVPDLLPRLSPLHSLLSTRLLLAPPLLSLAGRLDLALAQIEARQSEQARTVLSGGEGGVYVEGESSDDEDEGDIEEVGFGGSDEEESEGAEGESGEEEEEDEDEDMEDNESIDDSDDGEGGVMNGFIDDEASEDGSEGGDESSGDEE
ncbi:hypothetical protein BDY24DRAFT_373973 [Mrakia frigida]|uniref:Utp5p n=1 Tax=Mrakia frigida TaxID=29902 RepID=UPI003FCBFB26